MNKLSHKIDKALARLAWSLWTELGVAGLERKHRNFSIAPEELIVLTSVLSEYDPRLRDEALDWCVRYHHLISPNRLQAIVKKQGEYLNDFSTFSATFNAIANPKTKWITIQNASPLNLRPSCKSTLRDLKLPSMIYFRLRSLFGVGGRADVLAFFLTEERSEFSISDLMETGYSKKRLAIILGDLAAAGILTERKVRNQWHYSFTSRAVFLELLGDIPTNRVHWHRILDVILPIRACFCEVEEAPVGVRVIDLRNLLNKLSNEFLLMGLKPPPLQSDFEEYWNNVAEWFLGFIASLSVEK